MTIDEQQHRFRHAPGRLAGPMNAANESPWEVCSARRGLLNPKTLVKIGTWNVRSMGGDLRTQQAVKEMKRYNLDILGVSEARWLGSGKEVKDGTAILYAGNNERRERGVAIMFDQKYEKYLIEWKPVSDRIITARFNSKFAKLTLIQCYAPTNGDEEEAKDSFYDKLQAEISRVPPHDVLLVLGDFNAKVGSINNGFEQCMGRHGCGILNENGERLVDLCAVNGMVIGGTLFPHKDIHKHTWKSPDGTTLNQIDHILINKNGDHHS